ncbi:unnamed protein product [Didymodactylos carnosus]|uniref:Uncharacterized protein n=1 Tax=Didymodactylos carnosus TaxID=1234261 RepID=A0A815V640_9BILA|nr:unnamed protein product [Didymodactylos carnosus]CAF4384909.1 unnamed protein product [Didymodactylos carnosus]
MTSSSNPELKQLLDILGCKGETSSGNDQEKKSKFQSIMAKVTGDHGTGGFWKKIFGGSDNSKDFNAGTKLPDSNYELDESDAKTLNHFQKHH